MIEWKWIFWQVFIPLVAPIIISGIVIAAWMSGDNSFEPKLDIVLDVSPWALTFYALTLICSTINALWGELNNHTGISLFLIFTGIAVLLYASFMVIWRHDDNFDPGTPVYVVSIGLLVLSIFASHWGYKKRAT